MTGARPALSPCVRSCLTFPSATHRRGKLVGRLDGRRMDEEPRRSVVGFACVPCTTSSSSRLALPSFSPLTPSSLRLDLGSSGRVRFFDFTLHPFLFSGELPRVVLTGGVVPPFAASNLAEAGSWRPPSRPSRMFSPFLGDRVLPSMDLPRGHSRVGEVLRRSPSPRRPPAPPYGRT